MSSGPSRPAGPPPGSAEGWSYLSTLIAGIAVWGGAGFGLDRLLHTSFLLPAGAVVGVGLAIWLIYLRTGDPTAGDPPGPLAPSRRAPRSGSPERGRKR